MFATYGRDRVQAAKTRMQPLVTALVERAQRDGKLRADLRPTDMLFVSGVTKLPAPAMWSLWMWEYTRAVTGSSVTSLMEGR